MKLKINHNAENLHEVLGYVTEEEVEKYFDYTMWDNYNKIIKNKKLNDQEYAEILLHLISVYSEYDMVIPLGLASIYGMGSKEYDNILQDLKASEILEILVEHSGDQLKSYFSSLYVYKVNLDNKSNAKKVEEWK